MPVVKVNLADVKGYSDLPVGEYSGQIDQVKNKPATEEGKFDQLVATYTVIDGPLLGQKSSEFLSFSPKAAFRMKKWFDKFGLGDLDDLDIDDETELLLNPDLVGLHVIFRSRIDGKRPGTDEDRYRTELVTVDEDVDDLPGNQESAPVAEAVAAEAPRSLRPARTAVADPRPKRRSLQ